MLHKMILNSNSWANIFIVGSLFVFFFFSNNLLSLFSFPTTCIKAAVFVGRNLAIILPEVQHKGPKEVTGHTHLSAKNASKHSMGHQQSTCGRNDDDNNDYTWASLIFSSFGFLLWGPKTQETRAQSRGRAGMINWESHMINVCPPWSRCAGRCRNGGSGEGDNNDNDGRVAQMCHSASQWAAWKMLSNKVTRNVGRHFAIFWVWPVHLLAYTETDMTEVKFLVLTKRRLVCSIRKQAWEPVGSLLCLVIHPAHAFFDQVILQQNNIGSHINFFCLLPSVVNFARSSS